MHSPPISQTVAEGEFFAQVDAAGSSASQQPPLVLSLHPKPVSDQVILFPWAQSLLFFFILTAAAQYPTPGPILHNPTAFPCSEQNFTPNFPCFLTARGSSAQGTATRGCENKHAC